MYACADCHVPHVTDESRVGIRNSQRVVGSGQDNTIKLGKRETKHCPQMDPFDTIHFLLSTLPCFLKTKTPSPSPYACTGGRLREASRGNTSSVSLLLVLASEPSSPPSKPRPRPQDALVAPTTPAVSRHAARVSTGCAPTELVELAGLTFSSVA